MRRAVWTALVTVVLGACGGEAPPHADHLTSPLATVEAAFGPALFDVAARSRHFAPAAFDAFLLARRVDPKRYERLPVTELRRLDADRRAARVAFSVDDWPLALDVVLARGLDAWQVVEVPPPEEQQIWLDLLGPDGLPGAPNAEPWRGGLAGRDADGRPTAQVVVVAHEARVWVDGDPVANQHDPVVEAIQRHLQVRHRLAQAVHATAVPEVVIALPGGAAASRHALLADWAVEAGAEGLRLAVRGPAGKPATLPLARRGPRPRGPAAPPLVVIQRDMAEVRLQVGDQVEVVPTQAGGRLNPGSLAAAFQRLKPLRPVGAVLIANFETDHARTVDLLDHWQVAAPGLPLASRRP